MKIVSYSTKQYDRKHMDQVNQGSEFDFNIEYFDFPLTVQTAKMLSALMPYVSLLMMMLAVKY